MLVLRFENGPCEGQDVEVSESSVRLGKGPLNQVVLVDPKASLDHCMISETAHGLILRDLGSEQGTRVNDPKSRPIQQPVQIRAGDRIYIGDTIILLAEVLDESSPTIALSVPKLSTQRDVQTQEVRAYRKPAIPDDATLIDSPSQPAIEDVFYTDMVGRRAETVDTKSPSVAAAIVVDPDPGSEDQDEEFAQYGLPARLVFLSGPHNARRVFFDAGPITIGRGENNDVVIADPQVKLRSFRITKVGGSHRLEPIDDLPRLNGVGIPKVGAVLGHGQVITIGASEIEFLAPGVDTDAADAMETVVLKQPIFAFQGSVRKGESIVVGRDPDCEIFIDDQKVERKHAKIFFRMPVFHLAAIEGAPIYVDGARVVEIRLKNGDTATIGGHELRFEVQGYRVNIDFTPKAPDVDVPKYVKDVEVSSPFQTLVRLPGDFEIAKREDRQQVDREKLVWKEPHDVRRTWQLPLLVGTGVALALGVTGILMFDGGSSFLRRPISERHRSPEFARLVSEKFDSGTDSCGACHLQFRGPVDEQCERCHPGQKAALRPEHLALEALKDGACAQCHAEHPRERGVAALVNGQCASCHPDRHQKMKQVSAVVKKQEPPASAGVFPTANIRADLGLGGDESVALHRAHGTLARGCAACHAGGTGEREAPWGSCFGCHGPVKALDSKQCGQCHREHGEMWAKAAAEPLIPPSPAGTAMATLLLLFVPMGLIFFGHAAFKRRAAWEDKERESPLSIPSEVEPLKCDGVERGKAKRLPRLLGSRCTGSGDCVEACPYQVLEMEEKRPVLRSPELCHECGICVDVCGPGALMMWEPDKPLPMQPRPAIDPNYQTGVKGGDRGVYVIGEAAGKPLVKNGINVGFFTVHHMIHEGLAPGQAARAGVDYEVVIAGSGPAGISAAMTARQENLRYVLLEKRETFASTIQDYPKKKKLMESPPPPTPDYPQGVRLMGPLWIADTTREEAIARWSNDVSKLSIAYGESVIDIDPHGDGFAVKTKKGMFTCLRVILAPGTRGDPRRLGKPGDDLPKVRYRLIDAEEHNGHKVMVVGGGDSALEAAIQMAEVHGGSNQVCIVYRQDSFNKAKKGNREKIGELIKSGRVKAYFKANPEKVTEKTVVLDLGDEIENDYVYCMLGANPPTKWLESLGIKVVQKSIDWEPPPSDQPAFLQFTGTDDLKRQG